MYPDVIERLKRISLTAAKGQDITITTSQQAQALENCSLSLLGHFLATKEINLRVAKNLLRTIWKLGNDIKIVDVGEGLLLFRFKLESQLRWVQDNGPWSFDKHNLVLCRWEKGLITQTVSFMHIPLWVQVWGFPFDLLIEATAQDIDKGLGTIITVDNITFNSNQAHFLHIRVEVPLTQTLRCGGPIVHPEGDHSFIAFRYEQIVGLCYAWGRLGHKMKNCIDPQFDPNSSECPYGDWMKVGL